MKMDSGRAVVFRTDSDNWFSFLPESISFDFNSIATISSSGRRYFELILLNAPLQGGLTLT